VIQLSEGTMVPQTLHLSPRQVEASSATPLWGIMTLTVYQDFGNLKTSCDGL